MLTWYLVNGLYSFPFNPNTVQRAYNELEREGLVYSCRGKGLFVAEQGTTSARTRAEDGVRRAFDEGIRAGQAAGMTVDQLRDLFEAAVNHTARTEKTGI